MVEYIPIKRAIVQLGNALLGWFEVFEDELVGDDVTLFAAHSDGSDKKMVATITWRM